MEARETIARVLGCHDHDGTRLMQILREVQEALGWLAPETLTAIATGVGLPRAKVEATAAFYSFFHLRPRGEYCLLWSDNIIDRMAGSRTLMQRLCEALWLEPGKLSEDGLVFVHTTSDIGMGDQGPALLVNYRTVTRMTSERVDQMAELIRNRIPVAEWPRDWFRVDDNLLRPGPLLGEAFTPGEALRAALSRGPQAQLDEIAAAKLRGRGGAGFPTARKWQACRDAPLSAGQTRIVICNADEGEPGTFKDRILLNSFADLVFEGMTIAAFTVGARHGFLYLRGEYRYLLEALEAVLRRRRDQGLLGSSILGRKEFDFDIEIVVGAGAYVCGEESALIESLEGKPGRPRLKPPFPVTQGYLDQPTIVNNVETFACVARIAEKGAAWFAAFGTPQSTGTKLMSISGDVARPGVYEFPFGISVAEALDAAGVRNCVQGVQVSGPSGAMLTGEELGRRLCFEDLPTAGALMVFDCTRDMFDVAHNFAHFFAHESCGFCTPCRVGTQIVARLMDKLAHGHGSQYDLQELFKMHHLLRETSHCGLGQSACNPVFDSLTKFRPAYERRMRSLDFTPTFDLDAALSQARQMTGRDDAGAHLTNVET